MAGPPRDSADRAHIATTVAESTPSFTTRPRPGRGAPNIVIVVLDDLGFGQLGCFGSDLSTPTIDSVASQGLRYRRFHVTAMCSPTRAALLTGRNHHQVGMGFLTDVPIGFPGYHARIPRSAATLPRVLAEHGYGTFAVGKWHLAPRWDQSAAGPFDQWPLGLGFQRFYGFLNGDVNQFAPELVCDNGFVDPPSTPEDGYHLTEDLVDRARRMLIDHQNARPDAPFLLYLAPGATHAPHQAPRDWIDRFAGRFDDGWEAWRDATFRRQLASGVVPEGTVLPPRPSWIPEWSSLPAAQRRLFARQMECFAGFLAHTDDQLGRLMTTLDDLAVREQTMVMVLSDNGTSAEGGPTGSHNEHRFTHNLRDDLDDSLARIDELGGHRAYNHYAWGWAWAGNTPLRLWKRYSWLGGTRTPLVLSWPSRVAAIGELRSTFAHAIDLMPTVLEACGIEMPEIVDGHRQIPLAGRSLVASFDDASDPGRTVQYFEMLGSRSLYLDGYRVTTDHVGDQIDVERELVPGSHDFDDDHWALFDLRDDFAEATDLSAAQPDRVEAMRREWWRQAELNQVLPLDDSLIGRTTALEPNPNRPRHLTRLIPGGGPVSEDALPSMAGGFVLRVPITVATADASGVLCALGDWNNGWALLVHEGCPEAVFNLFGEATGFGSHTPMTAGDHIVGLHYSGAPERRADLSVDGAMVASTNLPADLPFRWQIGGAGLRIGYDVGFPVSDGYSPPFRFEGDLGAVTIEIPFLAGRDPHDQRTSPTDVGAVTARFLHHE
ncbi:MAG: arylsulfatase [Microthrixaceae bacterium]